MKKVFISLLLFVSSAFSEVYHTGLLFDDEAYDNAPRSATLLTRDISRLPTSISLEAYAPRVGSQGRTGTCTGWATAYGARTILESLSYHRLNKTETTQNVFSPSYVYNQIRLDSSCQGGSYIHHALELMVNQGVAKWNRFGFDCNRAIGYQDQQNASPYKIQGYKTLFARKGKNKVQLVKKALSQNKPVVIGMEVLKSFYDVKDVWRPKNNDVSLGGHAMVVVGYDDSRYGGSFRLMNSWGEKWGQNGFAWVRYQEFQRFTRTAYELIPKPLPTTQVTMGGTLKFINANGQPMNATYDVHRGIYVMNQSYYSGTQFNFTITNKEPIYLYAFGFDNTEKTFRIFPHNDRVSAYQGYTNSSIAFPDEFHYVRMDNTKGKDYFVVLYSKNPLKLDKIEQLIQNQKGTIQQRLRTVLGHRLISQNINFAKYHMDFAYRGHKNMGASEKDTVVAVIVPF
jgi:hypothetical protein